MFPAGHTNPRERGVAHRNAGYVGSEVEVRQAKTQLETTRAQAIDVGVVRAQYEHALAILIGKPPAAFHLAVSHLNLGAPVCQPFPLFCQRSFLNVVPARLSSVSQLAFFAQRSSFSSSMPAVL